MSEELTVGEEIVKVLNERFAPKTTDEQVSSCQIYLKDLQVAKDLIWNVISNHVPEIIDGTDCGYGYCRDCDDRVVRR